jgi:hypothetical protein
VLLMLVAMAVDSARAGSFSPVRQAVLRSGEVVIADGPVRITAGALREQAQDSPGHDGPSMTQERALRAAEEDERAARLVGRGASAVTRATTIV